MNYNNDNQKYKHKKRSKGWKYTYNKHRWQQQQNSQRPYNRRWRNQNAENSNLTYRKPPSPLPGSEEYTQRNIEQTSAFIKKQLNLDGSSTLLNENYYLNVFNDIHNEPSTSTCTQEIPTQHKSINNNNNVNKKKFQAQTSNINVKDIHDKIIKHITNLSFNKKLEFVNREYSVYDPAIEQIQKQKRLEISCKLKEMSKGNLNDNNKTIYSLIPDLDINIETLPREVMEELSKTLNYEVNENVVVPEECFKRAEALLKEEYDDDIVQYGSNVAEYDDNVSKYDNIAKYGGDNFEEYDGDNVAEYGSDSVAEYDDNVAEYADDNVTEYADDNVAKYGVNVAKYGDNVARYGENVTEYGTNKCKVKYEDFDVISEWDSLPKPCTNVKQRIKLTRVNEVQECVSPETSDVTERSDIESSHSSLNEFNNYRNVKQTIVNNSTPSPLPSFNSSPNNAPFTKVPSLNFPLTSDAQLINDSPTFDEYGTSPVFARRFKEYPIRKRDFENSENSSFAEEDVVNEESNVLMEKDEMLLCNENEEEEYNVEMICVKEEVEFKPVVLIEHNLELNVMDELKIVNDSGKVKVEDKKLDEEKIIEDCMQEKAVECQNSDKCQSVRKKKQTDAHKELSQEFEDFMKKFKDCSQTTEPSKKVENCNKTVEDSNKAIEDVNKTSVYLNNVNKTSKAFNDLNKTTDDRNKTTHDHNKTTDDRNKTTDSRNKTTDDHHNKATDGHRNKATDGCNKTAEDRNKATDDRNKATDGRNKATDDHRNKATDGCNKTVDDRNKVTDDLNKTTEDLNKTIETLNKKLNKVNKKSENRNKRTEDFNKKCEESTRTILNKKSPWKRIKNNSDMEDFNNKKIENHKKKNEDLNRKSEEFSKKSEEMSKRSDEFSKKIEELSKKSEERSAKTEQHCKKFDDRSKKNDDRKNTPERKTSRDRKKSEERNKKNEDRGSKVDEQKRKLEERKKTSERRKEAKNLAKEKRKIAKKVVKTTQTQTEISSLCSRPIPSLVIPQNVLEESQSKIMPTRKTIVSGSKTIENCTKTIDCMETIDNRTKTIDNRTKIIDDCRETIDDGRETIDDGRETIDDGRETIDDGSETIETCRETIEDRREPIDKHRETIDDCWKAIENYSKTKTIPKTNLAIIKEIIKIDETTKKLLEIKEKLMKSLMSNLKENEADGKKLKNETDGEEEIMDVTKKDDLEKRENYEMTLTEKSASKPPRKRRKLDETVVLNQSDVSENSEATTCAEDGGSVIKSCSVNLVRFDYPLRTNEDDGMQERQFKEFSGVILVIKIIEDSVMLAASDTGNAYFYNLNNEELLRTIKISNKAITSVLFQKFESKNLLYFGSLDGLLTIYDYDDMTTIKKQVKLEDGIQCMEYCWNHLFIGSRKGLLSHYNLKKEEVTDTIKVSESNVLVMKATTEGARKVLIVAVRNHKVSIRDAMSGLLLRELQGPFNPTVYTILLQNDLIHCGTSQHDILVYTFHDGQFKFKFDSLHSNGVVCLQIVGNLLYAGCYNGNIYVYNTDTKEYLGFMTGPGGLLLSMKVVNDMIIVGTKSSHLKSWKLPKKFYYVIN